MGAAQPASPPASHAVGLHPRGGGDPWRRRRCGAARLGAQVWGGRGSERNRLRSANKCRKIEEGGRDGREEGRKREREKGRKGGREEGKVKGVLRWLSASQNEQ